LNPLGPTDVSFYNFQINPSFGGNPGDGKNAIFSGHVDYGYAVHWADEAYYQGPGVFAGIGQLEPNDGIEVTLNGRTTRYRVVWKREVPEKSDQWGAIFAARVDEGDSITLVTCTGDFNPATQEYDTRTVIRASRFF
jgi:sortase (surface protein transpeptidase)